jgi:DNA-binding CsgD family transcriptional regulator
MDSYEVRKESGEQLIKQLINDSITDSFEQAIVLWKAGYSTRIIQEITGIHRSKISRYVNENNLSRDDDKRSQNRKNRVYQCQKLVKMGFSRAEIAQEMNINPRTVDSYFKEIGVKTKTKFKEMEEL